MHMRWLAQLPVLTMLFLFSVCLQCDQHFDPMSVLQKSTEFGYSRKDVLLIGAGIFGGGFAMYYGLQAGGVSAGMAGNFVQLFVVLGLCVGWIGSYIFRVANKVC